MYGDKNLPEKIDAIHKSGYVEKGVRVNIEHYITESEFKILYYTEKRTMKEIMGIISFPYNLTNFCRNIQRLGWKSKPGKQTVDVNEDFFKELNRDSAWVYGWLVTDGSIDYKSGHLKLMIHRKDKDVLLKIKEVMKFSGNVYDGEQRDGRVFSYLRICRKSMCEDLFELGMAETNKTFNTTFPTNLPDQYYWDFIRGVFEGDGSIAHRTGNTDALSVSICGATESFIDELQLTLLQRGIDTRKSRNKNGVYNIECRSNADALRMCYFMYANTTEQTRLNRKFNVFQNYVVTYYDKVKRRSTPCIELVELARQTIPECRDEYNAIATYKEAV